MDGLQRISTIYMFYNDDFKLEGLQVWKELNDKKYSELPEKIRQGIDIRYLSSIILLQETAKDQIKAQEMKQIVFERINSGGMKLEGQEIRNALYNGPMNELCKKLSKNKTFRILLGILENDDQFSLLQNDEESIEIPSLYEKENEEDAEARDNQLYQKMTDVEFVLRFFAMRQTPAYSQTTLGNFFDRYLINANQFDSKLLKKLEDLFNDTINLAYELFDERAFYLYREKKVKATGETKWSWYEKATSVIYDPMMYALSCFINKKDVLIRKRVDIVKFIEKFYEDNRSGFKGRNNNRSDIESRKKLFVDFFKTFCEES